MLDDQNELKEREIQFICDPSNKELFADEDEDEEDEIELVNTLLILAVVCILYRMYVYF